MIIDDTFLPIDSAPRTGVLIIVRHEDVGTFPMRWSNTATNDVFVPGVVGMWVMDDQMTWRDDRDGLSHWKPCPGELGSVH
ncbi:MAG TPA: hypothetical protein VIL88_17750 [Devosia sp.]|jgi:hypothetical protein|uniref:hypothetical protein n=1 Tax=Devosia sp. TaxID=1871048 RepID=UPI002F94D780